MLFLLGGKFEAVFLITGLQVGSQLVKKTVIARLRLLQLRGVIVFHGFLIGSELAVKLLALALVGLGEVGADIVTLLLAQLEGILVLFLERSHSGLMFVVLVGEGAVVSLVVFLELVGGRGDLGAILLSETILDSLGILTVLFLQICNSLIVICLKIGELLRVVGVEIASLLVVLVIESRDLVAAVGLELAELLSAFFFNLLNELPVLVLQVSLLLAEVLLLVSHKVGVTVINLAYLIKLLLGDTAKLIAVVVLQFAYERVVLCLQGGELVTVERLELVNLDASVLFGCLQVCASFRLQLGNFLGASSLESVDLGAVELLEVRIQLLGGFLLGNDLALVQLL